MTSRIWIVYTIILSVLMNVLLVEASSHSQLRLVMFIAIAGYLLATIRVIYLQIRRPEMARSFSQTFAIPSTIMGMLAGLMGFMARHHILGRIQ